ncbi:MAG: methyltransferase domain-containing protein [Dehalococcoidia bacterium]
MGDTAEDTYTHGHHPSVVAQHRRRTAEEAAAFLIPRLRPGMRVLDAGCGPGTITTGLARIVAPGEVIGIDAAEAVLDDARAHARRSGVQNVRFERANVYELPYDDATFDAAFAHQVLQHLSRPVDALREMKRVLRPGGLAGVRDSDYGTMTWWPRSPGIARWLEVYHAVAERNGADADAGRRIPAWLRAAGFDDIEITTSTWAYIGAEQVRDWGESWASRITESALAEQAVAYGIATPAELASIAEAWRTWTHEPDAFFTFIHVAGVGVKRPV